jgi:hypothetical protein
MKAWTRIVAQGLRAKRRERHHIPEVAAQSVNST